MSALVRIISIPIWNYSNDLMKRRMSPLEIDFNPYMELF